MKKKALLLASIGLLACTVGVTALAVGGANHLDAFPVKADPTGYSITFDASDESTTVEAVDDNYAICTTTADGNKVGVVGYDNDYNDCLSFRKTNFKELKLSDEYTSALDDTGAYEFSHITGLAVTFTGKLDLWYEVNDENVQQVVESGVKYDVSLDPYGFPRIRKGEGAEQGSVTISSLTIWYSCENL